MYKVAFRFDANNKIGYGHMMRCLALAEELRNLGCEIIIFSREKIVTSYNVYNIKTPFLYANKKGYVYESIENEMSEMNELLEIHKPDAIIVDHYGVTKTYFTEISKHVGVLIGIDDCNCQFGTYPVDMIINGNCYANKDLYRESRARILAGSKYTLLRKEFSNIEKRIISEEVKTIVISTGGSDPLDLTPFFVKIIRKINQCKNINKKIVIGSGFTNENIMHIKESIENDDSFELLCNANMKELMGASDIFISSSGSTMNELAVTGTPSVSVILSEDQAMIGEYFHKNQTTRNLGWYNKIAEKELEDTVLELIQDIRIRMEMSIRGQKVIDGKGCWRTAKEIVSILRR